MAKTDLAQLEAELAERAKSLSQQLGAPESKRITVDQKTGELIGPGGTGMGDSVKVVVVDFCTTKRYFDRIYDPANTTPPACMAIGDVISEMVPEEGVPAPQSPQCKTCWANQWESDARGKGKMCKETRDLVVVIAEELEDPDIEPALYLVACSPTSLKSFDATALRVHQLLGGMPMKAIMTMSVHAVENYYNLRFGDIEANPYLDRTLPLLASTQALLGTLPDFSKYEAPKKLPADDVRNSK